MAWQFAPKGGRQSETSPIFAMHPAAGVLALAAATILRGALGMAFRLISWFATRVAGLLSRKADDRKPIRMIQDRGNVLSAPIVMPIHGSLPTYVVAPPPAGSLVGWPVYNCAPEKPCHG
jgi:hypothetical protein